MSSVLLDTHTWIWYMNADTALSNTAKKAITLALYNNAAYVAAISLWEICMLEKKQRIVLEMPALDWMKRSVDSTHLRILPVTPAIAAESCHLPGEFHGDPADCMITATARVEGLMLITRDAKMLAYSRHGYIATIKA